MRRFCQTGDGEPRTADVVVGLKVRARMVGATSTLPRRVPGVSNETSTTLWMESAMPTWKTWIKKGWRAALEVKTCNLDADWCHLDSSVLLLPRFHRFGPFNRFSCHYLSVHEAPSRPPSHSPHNMFAMTTRVTLPVVASAAAPGASSRASRVSTARVSMAAPQSARLSVRACAEETAVDAPVAEDEFESRLGALRGKRSKRAPVDPSTKDAKDMPKASDMPKSPPKGQKRRGVADFTVVGSVEEPTGANWGPEQIMFEGPPARGEIVANVAMSWTLVWLPLTIGAIGRGLWSSYKITDKRVCVMSTSPLRTERTDVPLNEIVDVISIGRGVGLWGDMVITLRNQEKIELRSLPDFKKLEEHIRSNMGEADPEYARI